MYTSRLFESYNKKLEEKINKDNIEINKAIANPNAGKNKDKIKAAGYEPEIDDQGKVWSIKNPKNNKWIMPSNYNRDEKQKVDFKGKLDKDNSGINRTKRFDADIKDNKIPKSAKLNKGVYNNNEVEYYSPRFRDDKRKTISKNINDYNAAVIDRDEKQSNADNAKKSLSYYQKKIDDAKKDYDWHRDWGDKNQKMADDAEARRKAIIDNIRKRKTESEQLNESIDFEDMLKELYNSYKQDGMEDSFWSDLMNCIDNLDYLNQWYSSLNESAKTKLKEEYSEKLGGDPEDFVSDVQSILDTLNTIDTSKFGSHLAEEIVEEFIETCNYQIEKGKRLVSKDEFYTESEDIK